MEQSEQSKLVTPADRPAVTATTYTGDADKITVQDAISLLQSSSQPALPFLNPMTGEPVAFLVRPNTRVLVDNAGPIASVSPRLGGMATPLGVYLHDGLTGGGAGALGLMLTGALFGVMGIIAQTLALHIITFFDRSFTMAVANAPALAVFVTPMSDWGTQMLLMLTSVLIVLCMLRLLPISGTHAAEHQVVHSVEQNVPLTVSLVRNMPRVHPRCGTNLLVGMLLFVCLFVGTFLSAVSWHVDVFDSAILGVVVAAPFVFSYWRRIGGFMQYWLATRPATDAQLAGAIHAAEQVLAKRSAMRGYPVRFKIIRRVWAIGLPQLIIGCGFAYILVRFLVFCFPGLGPVLGI